MTAATRLSVFLIFFSQIIIYLIGLPILISTSIFLFGGHIYNNSVIIILAVLLSIILITWHFKKLYALTVFQLLRNFFWSFLIIGTSTIVVGKFYDKSWDGLTYHQMAVLELSQGWNPFYEKLPDSGLHSRYTGRIENMNLYINHYAKGSEIFAGVLMGATGNVETGKIFNLLLMLSAFSCVLHLLLKLKQQTNFWILITAVAAAFNPIAVNQLFSYYVDGAIGSLLLLLICHFVFLLSGDQKRELSMLVTVFFIIVILINLKFTGPVYLAWIGAVFMGLNLYLRQMHRASKFMITAIAAGATAVLIVGFNPYVLNTYHYGHPLYPIAGENKIDVISGVMPEEFENSNALQKFIKSTFAQCDNFDKVDVGKTITYKIPFSVTIPEIKTFQSEATRLSGFGVLWSGIFCISVLSSIVLVLKLKGKTRIYFITLLIGILGSVITNPESWWARFVPHLWLFPVITCIFLMLERENKVMHVIGKSVLIFMLANTTIIGFSYSYAAYANTKKANHYFDSAKKSDSPVFVYFDIFLPNIRKFEDRNIPFVRIHNYTELPCENKATILKMQVCDY